MPANGRPPSFQFYPRDFLSDPAVQMMTLEQQGAYFRLLCFAWMQTRPGWLPDDPEQLSALSGLGERWLESRSAIARAFTIRRGWWIQRRMVRERRSQFRRYNRASKGASITNEKRWGSVARRQDSDSLSVSPASASASASAVKDLEPTHMPISDGRVNGLTTAENLRPDPRGEWIEAFENDFYPNYPRKVARDDALKAWLQMKPWSPVNLELICSGTDAWVAAWKRHETPKDKIPYPASFLRSGQWKGDPE